MAKINRNRKIFIEDAAKKKLKYHMSLLKVMYEIKNNKLSITTYTRSMMDMVYESFVSGMEKIYGKEYMDKIIESSNIIKENSNIKDCVDSLYLDKVILFDICDMDKTKNFLYDIQDCINDMCSFGRANSERESFNYSRGVLGFYISWDVRHLIHDKSEQTLRRFISPILFVNSQRINAETLYHEMTHMLDAMLIGDILLSTLDRDCMDSAMYMLSVRYAMRHSSGELLAYTCMVANRFLKLNDISLEECVCASLDFVVSRIDRSDFTQCNIYKFHKNIKYKGRR